MKIAVLIPCYNEELTIAKVVRDFKKQLPTAAIYVYDNNSTDQTALRARQAGAMVKRECRQGKGYVVRTMFKEVEADTYVLVDGDDTYPAEDVHQLIEAVVEQQADMSIGDRLTNGTYARENKRSMHNFGNGLVRGLINLLFQSSLNDIMSGYRVFNKEFVKNMPVLSGGFEIETEMSLHALDKNFIIKEIPIVYRDRPKGSFSKLNTLGDGFRVLRTLFWIFKDYKPLTFFGITSVIFFLLGFLVGLPVISEFVRTGKILRMPSAVLAVGLMMLSSLAITCGMILDTIVKQHREIYELIFKSHPPLPWDPGQRRRKK